MFEIGWTEMLVIAVVLIVVVGPKDLPKMLRTFGKTTSNLRRMAGDFRKQFDDAMKEAELDDIKSAIDGARKLNPAADIRKALNPLEKAAADVRSGLDQMMKPKVDTVPSPTANAQPAEPLKGGATAMPGEAAPVAAASVAAEAPAPVAAAPVAPAPVAAPSVQASPVAVETAAAPPPKRAARAPKAAAAKAEPAAKAPTPRKTAAKKNTGADS